jgi:general stress protein 26
MSADVIEKTRALIEHIMAGDLATVEGTQPRVRPVAIKWVGERELWFATGTGSRKVAQLESNPAVEVCFSDAEWNHVRLSGRATMTQDDGDRQKLFGMIKELAQHFSGPTDPNYTLVKIAIARIEYMAMGTEGYQTHEF